MLIDDKVLKRFEFDLKMGRFVRLENHRDTIYMFALDDEEAMLVLEEILTKLGYSKENSKTHFHNPYGLSVRIETKTFWYFGDFIWTDSREDYNEIPDYIKELSDNDIWRSL